MGRSLAFLAVTLLALSFPAAPSGATAMCDEPDLVAWVGLACPRADGLLDVYTDDGEYAGTVHGPDPASSSTEADAGPAPVAPTCVPLGTSYSLRVIYARAANAPDAYAARAPEIREMVHVANGFLAASAGKLGAGVSMRVQCTGGVVDVANVHLGTSTATMAAVSADLKAKGYTDPTAKYWVWFDGSSFSNLLCGGGVGNMVYDERPGAENWNNGNTGPFFAVTWECYGLEGAQVMAHEITHNLGGVQLGAPNTSGAGHCIDGQDVMCYDDGGPRGGSYTTRTCDEETYDCNNDDYFHPSPPSGSYLSRSWNVASTNNRYLVRTPCALQASGLLWAGNPAGMHVVGVVGVDIARQPVPSSCWGRPFGLTGVGVPPQDFDVCMETATARLQCYETDGSEEGVIPAGTTRAAVFYYSGALGEWRLGAS